MKTQAFVLASRPEGEPTQENFAIETVELPEVRHRQVLVEVVCYTVDPYMRGRMNSGDSYVPAFEVGKPLDGGMVGKVLQSEHPNFAPGDLVVADRGGWKKHAVVDGDDCRPVDTSIFEPSDYLGAAGMPGITAYGGFFEVGKPVAGDVVLVSAASGAVGSLVCQFAKLAGCTVIGSAGSREKVHYLKRSLGVDAAFNYKEESSILEAMKQSAPNGIDIYWDNVGGEFLEAAISCLNVGGRIVSCGMISGYNDESPDPGPRNLMLFIGKRLKMQGFLSFEFQDKMPVYLKRLAQWKKSGLVQWETTRLKGFEKGADALLGLFKGENLGKMVVEP